MNIKVILLFSYFALSVLAFSTVLAQPIAGREAGPERLTKSQMDAITAGTAGVTMGANAAAAGESRYTYTKTNTYAFSTPGNVVQVGLGSGLAYARGSSDTDASVEADYYGDGFIVVGNSFEVEKSNPKSSSAIGGVAVIAINLPIGQ